MANFTVELTASPTFVRLFEDLIAAIDGHAVGSVVAHRAAYTNEIKPGPKPDNREPFHPEASESARSASDTVPGDSGEADTLDPSIASAAEQPEYALVQVRAKLADLNKTGKDVKGLLSSFGVKKLSDLATENYAALMQKAEEL